MATVRRRCNAFESVFAGCNIRFGAAVTFPSCPLSSVEAAIRSALWWDLHGVLELQRVEENWVLTSNADRLALTPEVRIGSPDVLRDFCTEMALDRAPGCSVVLLDQGENRCSGFLVNANHALADGRAMTKYLERCLEILRGDASSTCGATSASLVDWGEFLDSDVEPEFLDQPGPPLLLSNIRRASAPSCSSVEIRHEVDAVLFGQACEKARAGGSSVTGLLVACLELAAAAAFFRRSEEPTCSPSVSVLVDLRPHLPDMPSTAQAIGTVTTGAKLDRAALDPELGGLWTLAAAATADIKARVLRGEAIAQARSLTQGRFDQGGAPGTIELSNLGCLRLKPGEQMHFSQRFDEYEGLSILSHQNGPDGPLRFCSSVGRGNDLEILSALLDQAVSFLRLAAE
ncbi:unnamed protein product [Effrenium voratum]|nr:unnamed protein product [Effrenium voratum]